MPFTGRLIETQAPAETILIRLLVGGVFLSEGIQKFLFAAELGVGRFDKIGMPAPGMMAPFVGIVEIVCGGPLLLGLFTRLVAATAIGAPSVASIAPRFRGARALGLSLIHGQLTAVKRMTV